MTCCLARIMLRLPPCAAISASRSRTLRCSALAAAAPKKDYRRNGAGGGVSAESLIPARPRSEAEEAGAEVLLAAAAQEGSPRVTLARGKARLFWGGNPIVFGGAVADVTPGAKTGDAVLVTDHAGAPLGWGTLNTTSMYRVRMLAGAAEAAAQPQLALNVDATVGARVRAATALRHRLGLPSTQTDTYRLLNSEGDRLSGLVADVFGPYVVAACSAAWAEQRRGVIAAQLLAATPTAKAVLWRPSAELLKKEGLPEGSAQPCYFTREGGEHALPTNWSTDGASDGAGAALPSRVRVMENGVAYLVSLQSGQKTGSYCDQRENRQRVRAASSGARVLDLCCYSGGFSLSAALGGATSVTGVDSSAAALALATENAALNHVSAICQFVQADVMEYLVEAQTRSKQTYDVVILDPPKLAPSRDVLAKAAGRYRRLNSLAASLVAPGGMLLTCTCSGAMTQSGTFAALAADAAAAVGRHAALLAQAGPAACHVTTPAYAEGNYLTACFFGIE